MIHNTSHTGSHGRRLRGRKACVECRRRKRKCDGLSPCLMCSQYDYQCRYNEESLASNLSGLSAIGGEGTPPKPRQSSTTSENSRQGPQGPQGPEGSQEPQGHVALVDRGILDPSKARYMSQNSAIAFPNQLGVEFESVNPPRLHSFAWNCGIRPEELPSSHTPLTELVSLEECRRYAEVYFSTVHDAFCLLERQSFFQQCDHFWGGSGVDLVLGAVIGGVVALGSVFAFCQGHAREAEVVKHVKDVLEDSSVCRRPSVDQINAWILRTLYLRSTTRPHLAWMASSIAMHLAEAVGLHRNVGSDILTCGIATQTGGERRSKRIFSIAWCINTIVAYDYGRTRKTFDSRSCAPAVLEEQGNTGLQLRMAQIIPDETRENMDLESLSETLQSAVRKLHELENVCDFPALCRADICFCLYRRLRLLKFKIDKDVLSSILSIGHTAVETAHEFAQKGVPWWNILSTPFQFFCVLLAIDSRDSLSQVSWAISKLEEIVQILDTHMAFEALQTAKVLLRDSMAKKRQELALMEMADGDPMSFLGKEINLDWDTMLDPYTGNWGFPNR